MSSKKYSGADWLEENGLKLSPLGRQVADVVGFAWRGIYHLDSSSVRRATWHDERCVELLVTGELATHDFSALTELVILCHDRAIRLSIRPASPQRLRLMFHQRESEAEAPKRVSIGHPTIEQAIERVRGPA